MRSATVRRGSSPPSTTVRQYAEEDAVAALDAQLALLFGGRPD
ncbi:hypothetical protein [Streptomyces niveus]